MLGNHWHGRSVKHLFSMPDICRIPDIKAVKPENQMLLSGNRVCLPRRVEAPRLGFPNLRVPQFSALQFSSWFSDQLFQTLNPWHRRLPFQMFHYAPASAGSVRLLHQHTSTEKVSFRYSSFALSYASSLLFNKSNVPQEHTEFTAMEVKMQMVSPESFVKFFYFSVLVKEPTESADIEVKKGCPRL